MARSLTSFVLHKLDECYVSGLESVQASYGKFGIFRLDLDRNN